MSLEFARFRDKTEYSTNAINNFPTKIIPPPCTQGLSRSFAVYDMSAVLECKDSKYFALNEEKREKVWNLQKKLLSLQCE
jgi:hypothetical protein